MELQKKDEDMQVGAFSCHAAMWHDQQSAFEVLFYPLDICDGANS